MDGRAVTSSGVVKISRLALRLRRSARGEDPLVKNRHVTFGPSLPGSGSGPLRAERRRREARREIFTIPRLVTARPSILGPPAEGRPGPS